MIRNQPGLMSSRRCSPRFNEAAVVGPRRYIVGDDWRWEGVGFNEAPHGCGIMHLRRCQAGKSWCKRVCCRTRKIGPAPTSPLPLPHRLGAPPLPYAPPPQAIESSTQLPTLTTAGTSFSGRSIPQMTAIFRFFQDTSRMGKCPPRGAAYLATELEFSK